MKKLLFYIILILAILLLGSWHREDVKEKTERVVHDDYFSDYESPDDIDECVYGDDTVVVTSWWDEEDPFTVYRDDNGNYFLVNSGRYYGIGEDDYCMLTPAVVGLQYLEVRLRKCVKHSNCWVVDAIKEY